MKRLFAIVFFLFIFISNTAFAQNNIAGRWAEKISERVVMDIYPTNNTDEFLIFITWRENNLAQKDIYRFKGKSDKYGNLRYTNGVHLYRYYDSKGKFEDKTDYIDGSGIFEISDNEIVWVNFNDSSKSAFIPANENLKKDTTVKNNLFSIMLPEEFKGLYEVKTEKDKISVFHKDSKNTGFGGFVFGIKAYKNPAEHACLPGSKKIGELVDKNGILYDIVLKYPTDVQYDYTKEVEPNYSYRLLYELGESVNIKGLNGAIFFKNQGMEGQNLYKEVLEKHLIAIKEKWDSKKLEEEDMSYMYNIIPNKNKIGYTYYDVNADGIDELLIGEIADGAWKGVIYDIYTMVDREPKHVISGGSRNRYYVCDENFICNEYSSGAKESGVRVYHLVENSTELFHQLSFKYDGYENPDSPYFISYSDDKWENYPKDKFNERKKTFEKYERFDFKPINIIKITQNLTDRYNPKKDYFDYSVVLKEFPKDYYYTTVKINKSKERIMIITDKVNNNQTSYKGLFYYIAENGFVYPMGLIESTKLLSQSENYIYINDGKTYIKFYMSDKKFEIVKSKVSKINECINNIYFVPIASADKFAGDFGSPAGDDLKKITTDGFYFEYHKPQYKGQFIKNLMNECIKDGVKTQVQMYCCIVNKLHK